MEEIWASGYFQTVFSFALLIVCIVNMMATLNRERAAAAQYSRLQLCDANMVFYSGRKQLFALYQPNLTTIQMHLEGQQKGTLVNMDGLLTGLPGTGLRSKGSLGPWTREIV